MKKYITQETIKKNNTADIFTFILKKQCTTRREIERETGFSWGMVSSNVAYLIEQGYIVEEKIQDGNVGRTTKSLRINGEKYVSIGLDVNRTELRAEIVGLDLSLKKVFTEEFFANTQRELLVLSEKLCKRAIKWCEGIYCVFSLGIAFQGIVDGEKGVSIRFPGISDWESFNIKDYFANKFLLPVYLAHDPKCALSGILARKQVKDCVLVRIDEGIGMAVAQNDKILDDLEKFELGSTIVVLKSGKRVTLEDCASIRGITNRSKADFKKILSDLQRYETIIEESVDVLALSLYNVFVLFRPQMMILTGRAMEYEFFVSLLRKKLEHINTELYIDTDVSAAFGAAAESIYSAIKNFNL